MGIGKKINKKFLEDYNFFLFFDAFGLATSAEGNSMQFLEL